MAISQSILLQVVWPLLTNRIANKLRRLRNYTLMYSESQKINPDAFFSWCSTHIKKFKRENAIRGKGICPFHDDRKPSLSAYANTGIFVCGGCRPWDSGKTCKTWPYPDFCNALGVPVDKWVYREQYSKFISQNIEYVYLDEDGKAFFKVTKWYDKDGSRRFKSSHIENGSWIDTRGKRIGLYNLPLIRAQLDECLVFWVEGEKDCETLRRLNLPATTAPFGSQAGGLIKKHLCELRRFRTVCIPDNDDTGEDYAKFVCEGIRAAGGKAQIMRLGDPQYLREGFDVSDFVEREERDGRDPRQALLSLVNSLTWEGLE